MFIFDGKLKEDSGKSASVSPPTAVWSFNVFSEFCPTGRWATEMAQSCYCLSVTLDPVSVVDSVLCTVGSLCAYLMFTSRDWSQSRDIFVLQKYHM